MAFQWGEGDPCCLCEHVRGKNGSRGISLKVVLFFKQMVGGNMSCSFNFPKLN